MAEVIEAHRAALAHFQRGQLREAEVLCRRILEAEPGHAESFHLLGLVAHQAGDHESAVKLMSQAIALSNDCATFHCNLGVIYHAVGSLQDAEQSLRRGVAIDPNQADAHYNLGHLLRSLNQVPAAIDSYRRTIELKSDFADPYSRLGALLQTQGDLPAAIWHFQQAVRLSPQLSTVYADLGQALHSQGRAADAIACYQEALRRPGNHAPVHFNLATIYEAQQQIERAVASYREAVQLDPSLVPALARLGALVLSQGDLTEAVACFEQAARLLPDNPDLQFNLGCAYHAQGQYASAIACYQQALRLNPGFVPVYFNLGSALKAEGRLAEALSNFEAAAALQPDSSAAHFNLGTLLLELGKPDAAATALREAVRLDPAHLEAMMNLGELLQAQARPNEALELYHQVIQRKPDFAPAYVARGNIYRFKSMMREAIAEFDTAIALEPDDPMHRYNRAAILLRSGDFDRGWPEYESRLSIRHDWLPSSAPRWRGEDLRGQKIIVYAEQGFGDTLQFIRFLPLVEQRGGEVHFAVDDRMIPILRESGIKNLIPWRPLRDEGKQALFACDWQVPLMSLPGILRITLDNLPAKIPYLAANEELVAKWRRKLRTVEGFKVGIHWHGNKDDARTIPLAEFAPLAKIGGIRLMSLQKFDGTHELQEIGNRFAVFSFGDELDATGGAFMDSAAIIKQLDLVVTCDTSVAHLAAGLGVPVWVALPKASEWRWMLDRTDSPWYPTMRLFRQKRQGDWRNLFAEIADSLRALVGKV